MNIELPTTGSTQQNFSRNVHDAHAKNAQNHFSEKLHQSHHATANYSSFNAPPQNSVLGLRCSGRSVKTILKEGAILEINMWLEWGRLLNPYTPMKMSRTSVLLIAIWGFSSHYHSNHIFVYQGVPHALGFHFKKLLLRIASISTLDGLPSNWRRCYHGENCRLLGNTRVRFYG